MQKVVTIRASQSDLEDCLQEFTDKGWKVMSVVKGSEWGRVGFSYKWTVILEKDEKEKGDDKEVEKIRKETSSASYVKAIGLVIILILILIIIPLCLFNCAV